MEAGRKAELEPGEEYGVQAFPPFIAAASWGLGAAPEI
jgi:hypothetical protein